MKRPVIAVAARYTSDDKDEKVVGLEVRRAVATAIVAAGGLPVMIAVEGGDLLAESLDLADALLMPGGGDSDPALYGQQPHPKLNQVSPEQDRADTAILAAALQRQLPVLGICRGMQSLNVALGGDLVQHLEETSVEHRDSTHPIMVCEPDSLIERLIGAPSWEGRSLHHQVVGRLGDGLRATARTQDGQVEAIEHRQNAWLGVQWHPELQCGTDPAQLAPFRWLVSAASSRSA
ncbi:gamma-glutamyl-gamma-aminobutyrate hydrolase family protein [Calidifontibacter terrae]